jgi:hypothetical protein
MPSVTWTAARQAPRSFEMLDDVAVLDAALGRILRMHARDLAAAMLGPAAMAAEVELAVQPRARLIGDEDEGRSRVGHIGGPQPGWMAGAIRLAEARDPLREDLQLAARRRQRMRDRVGAEGAQAPAIIVLLGHVVALARLELGEARRGRPACASAARVGS